MNRWLYATLCLATPCISACAAASDTTTGPPTVQHLYVSDNKPTGSLRSYALPLTATSTPVAAIPMNAAFAIGVNATTLAVTGLSGNVAFFTLPLTSTSVSYATFAGGLAGGTPLFAASGSLYQGGSGRLNVYTPPFSNTSAPVSSIQTGGLDPDYLAVDPSGRVYVTAGATSIGVITGTTLTTTLVASPGTQFRGLAATATQLFACGFLFPSYFVYVYTLPLTTAATPAISIPVTTGFTDACVVDAGGNLYVGSNGTIKVFTPPFSSSSVPSLTLTTAAAISGMAVGP